MPSQEELRERLYTEDPSQERDLFAQAAELTLRRFGRRVALFAPLYVSNVCVNNCLYCGFRRDNSSLERRCLSSEEIQSEAKAISDMGHQTVLIVAGEHPEFAGHQAIADAILSVRRVPAIREVKVEVMPMSVEGYRQLYETGAGAVVLYQETYDQVIYAQAHPSGPKAIYDWRLTAMHRAASAGFRRMGLGILLGLGDAASDAALLIAHARSIHARWGFWPSTVSLPRLQAASKAPWSIAPPHSVDDRTFLRLVASIRVALPEVGIVLSTRENPTLRDRMLELGLGITHLSAGSQTQVGGYVSGSRNGLPASSRAENQAGQFTIQDERPVSDVVDRLKDLGYEPVWVEEALQQG